MSSSLSSDKRIDVFNTYYGRTMGVLHCIVNPASRDHTCGKRWPSTSKKLESKGFEVVTHMTERVGHAAEIAWELRKQKWRAQLLQLVVMEPCMKSLVLCEVVIFRWEFFHLALEMIMQLLKGISRKIWMMRLTYS